MLKLIFFYQICSSHPILIGIQKYLLNITIQLKKMTTKEKRYQIYSSLYLGHYHVQTINIFCSFHLVYLFQFSQSGKAQSHDHEKLFTSKAVHHGEHEQSLFTILYFEYHFLISYQPIQGNDKNVLLW